MSYFGHTLLPTVEGVFHETRSADLPSSPALAAQKVRAAGYPREAAYLGGLSAKDLQNVYEWAGLVSRERLAEEEAWAMAEEEWLGR